MIHSRKMHRPGIEHAQRNHIMSLRVSALCLSLCRQAGLSACPATEGRAMLGALFSPLHWAPKWHGVHEKSPGLSLLSPESREQRATHSLTSAT